jgi:hypothetical protein
LVVDANMYSMSTTLPTSNETGESKLLAPENIALVVVTPLESHADRSSSKLARLARRPSKLVTAVTSHRPGAPPYVVAHGAHVSPFHAVSAALR